MILYWSECECECVCVWERERERERKREREKEIKYGETSIGTNPMNSSAPKLAELETIYNRKNWIFCHFVHTGGQ